jgi:TolA-binding protein
MNRTSACPPPVELTRELSIGPSEKMSAHLARCERCAAEWASIERVATLAKALPQPEPDGQRVDAVRRSLLGAAAVPTLPRRSVSRPLVFATAAAAAIALVLGGYLLFRAPVTTGDQDGAAPLAEVYRAVIHAQPGADHAVVGAQPDEIVRLSSGTATFEVEHLELGERFRVVTGDAEVEVRGTVFDVTVEDDRLVSVHVISGEVEVRPYRAEDVTLLAGQWWRRPTTGPARERPEQEPETVASQAVEEPPTQPADERPAPGSRPVRIVYRTLAPAETSTPRPTERDPVAGAAPPVAAELEPVDPQHAFDRGWAALRGGDYQTAAKELDMVATSPDPISEDASFWRSVALARAGNRAQAVRSLQSFLSRFPGSPRAGEASVMLGRLLLDAGNLDGAEARFRAALSDPGARIRASAQAGLSAIADKRAR